MKKFLLPVFIFVVAALPAQHGIFTFYSVSEGLAQSTVTGLYRDSTGYLWIGTGDGLSVFNGYEFRNFKSRYGDSTSLTNNRIRGVYPAGDGQHVWVGSEDGLNLFTRNATGAPKAFRVSANSKTLIPIWSNDTASWIMNPADGVYRYSNRLGKLILQYHYNTYLFYKAHPLKTPGEFAFVDKGGEILRYSVYKGEIAKYKLPAELKPEEVHSVMEMEQEVVLLGTMKGVWQLDMKNGNFSQYELGDPFYKSGNFHVKDMCFDPEGRLWITCTNDGLYLYDPKLRRVRPCEWEQTGESVRKSLSHIQMMICDAYGVLWAGTDGDGLVRINTRRIFFGEEYLSPVVTDTCGWFIRSLFMNGERMFIGTFNEGLKTIDMRTGEMHTLCVEQGGKAAGSVNAIAPGPGNSLYVGSETGVMKLDTVTWKMEPVPVDENASLFVTCMLRTRNGVLFVGTKLGLFKLGENGRLTMIGKVKTDIQAMEEEADGTVVVSSFYYALHFYSPDGTMKHEILFGKPATAIPQITLINGIVTENGKHWASSNLGLLEFTPDWSLQKIYTDLDGLPENMLYGLALLPDHTMVIATGKGVSFFDPAHGTFTNYASEDGLKSDECNSRAVYFSNSNYVLIGGVKGFDYVRYPFRRHTLPAPAILLDQQQVFENSFQPGEQDFYAKQMTLGFQQNTFSFQLWQTDFAFSERAVFHYSLNGFDAEEVNAGHRRYVRYAGVNPGEYTFSASVVLPGDKKTSQANMLSVVIVPPFWQTTWFMILSVVVILLLITLSVYFAARVRYKKQLRKLEMQRELERVRIRISGDIHDDIGAGLTRIALAGDLASMQLQENDPQKERIAGMAVSARALSQSLKEVVWSVKPDYDRYDSMVRYFRDYCGEFFESTSVRCNFRTDETLSSTAISPEVRRNLFLVLKESLNNIVKHAGASIVEVHVHLDGKKLSMSVCDNGKGMDPAKESGMNSSGLKNMKRRAEMIRFGLEIGENHPGTCIRITGELEER